MWSWKSDQAGNMLQPGSYCGEWSIQRIEQPRGENILFISFLKMSNAGRVVKKKQKTKNKNKKQTNKQTNKQIKITYVCA